MSGVQLSPHRLGAGLGYNLVNFDKNTPIFHGVGVEVQTGYDLISKGFHHFYVDGIFRYGSASSSGRNPFMFLHATARVGYEFHVNDVLSLKTYLGGGVDLFHSSNENDPLHFDEAYAATFPVGVVFNFLNGSVSLEAEFQQMLGLVATFEDQQRTFYPQAFWIGGTVDLFRLVSYFLDKNPSFTPLNFKDFWNGFQTPRLFVYSDLDFNLSSPKENASPGYVVDGRATLQRQSSATNPLGILLNVGFGTENRKKIFAHEKEEQGGLRVEWEEWAVSLRLPCRFAFQVGKHYMSGQTLASEGNEFFPYLDQDHESVNNNSIKHSYQFHYSHPVTFGLLRGQYLITDWMMASASFMYDGENLLDPKGAKAGALSLAANWNANLTAGLNAFVGKEEDKFFVMGKLQTLACFPASSNCSLTDTTSRLNLGVNAVGGYREGDGYWVSAVADVRFNPIRKILSLSAQGEIFHDPQGIRTETSRNIQGMDVLIRKPQTIGAITGTLEARLKGMVDLPIDYRIRAGYTYSRSTTKVFGSSVSSNESTQPIEVENQNNVSSSRSLLGQEDHQFNLSAAIVY